MGYFLFVVFVERVSGFSFCEFVNVWIFELFGMMSLYFYDDLSYIVLWCVNGYVFVDFGWQISQMMLLMVGDGGLFMIVWDFVKWNVNFDCNEFGDVVLFVCQFEIGKFVDGLDLGYVVGFSIGDYCGFLMVSYGGVFVGY